MERIKDEYPGFSKSHKLDFLELIPGNSYRLGEHGAIVLDGGQLTPRKF